MEANRVHEMRVCVTAEDYDEAVRFYRDVLGLPEREAYSSEDGRVSILEAGRATLELLDPRHAEFVDEVEVGRRVAGHVRVALEVEDAAATAERLAEAGATVVAEARRTPWNSLNARLDAPAGLQLTLFTELGDVASHRRVAAARAPLFDHLTLRVRDLERSRAFYEHALQPFGVRVVQSSQGPIGFATDDRGDFWIKEGGPAAPVHLAFAAIDRVIVDAFHAAALRAGGTDNGPPGLRPHYGAGYYAAYVLDPDGNNVEAVFGKLL